jgi:serine protease SohB
MHFLSEWGLFLAKTLTMFLALSSLFILFFYLKQRSANTSGQLVVHNLNFEFDDLERLLKSEVLPKKDFKAYLKQKKKADKLSDKNQIDAKPNCFVLRFDGDIRASEVESLREIVSAILAIATSQDEVIAIVESAGGYVANYGLAASQLKRIRDKQIPLTVSVDKIAASGGYLMACVADKIIAAPFAILGSIGVVAQVPNLHRFLDKHDIDIEMHTAGQYKRTLTMLGENTPEGRKKFIEDLNLTHSLFKDFVKTHRPTLDIDKVATGEHWHGNTAIHYGLIDQIQTSDDYIRSKHPGYQIFEVDYEIKQPFIERLGLHLSQGLFNVWSKFNQNIIK